MNIVKQGLTVYCQVCKKRKAPHGRDVSSHTADSWCHDTPDNKCPGYYEFPKPGCLWPGETSKSYGFEHCDNAIEEIEDGEDVCDSCGEKAKLSRGECMVCVLNQGD